MGTTFGEAVGLDSVVGVATGAAESGVAGAGRGVDGEEDGWSAMKRRPTADESCRRIRP